MKAILVSVMLATAALPLSALAATSPAVRPAVAQMPRILAAPSSQIVPQYNTPGAQLALPGLGNPVQQLSPLGSVNSLVGSPVVQLPPIVNPLAQPSPLGSTIVP